MGRGFFSDGYWTAGATSSIQRTSPCVYIDLYSVFCKTYLFADTRPDHSGSLVVSVKLFRRTNGITAQSFLADSSRARRLDVATRVGVRPGSPSFRSDSSFPAS